MTRFIQKWQTGTTPYRMKNIVFLGAKKIGLECLKVLHSQSSKLEYNILGVLTNSRGNEIKAFSQSKNIPVIASLDQYLDLETQVDIAISVQYHEILRKKHIEKAKQITINLHMAPLPEYRGCNQFSFAILDGKDYFGTTIHRLEEGIDSGDILFESRFSIPMNIWVKELHEITQKKSLNLFKKSLGKLVNGDYELIPQSQLAEERGTTIHYRKEIDNIKQIDLSWPAKQIEKHIRATYFPGFEPPYTKVNSEKIYFTKEE